MPTSKKSLMLLLLTLFCLISNPMAAQETGTKPTYRHIVFNYEKNPGLDVRITQIPGTSIVRIEERIQGSSNRWTDLILAKSTVEISKLEQALMRIRSQAHLAKSLNISTSTCSAVLGGFAGMMAPLLGSALSSTLGLDTVSSLLFLEALSLTFFNATGGAVLGVYFNQQLFQDLFNRLNPSDYKSAMAALENLRSDSSSPTIVETQDYRYETVVVDMEKINSRPLEFRFALKHLLEQAYKLPPQVAPQ